MFAPLPRSRFAHQSVCTSCLSTVYRRSKLPRCQIRSNNLTTAVDTASISGHDETDLSLLKASIGNPTKKPKQLRPARKAGTLPVPKKTFSSNRKAIEALKAVLKADEEPNDLNDLNLVPKGHKKKNPATTKQSKDSTNGEQPPADLENRGRPIVAKSHKKRRRTPTKQTKKQIAKQKIAVAKEVAPSMDAGCDEADDKKDLRPNVGKDHVTSVSSQSRLTKRTPPKAKKLSSKPKSNSASEAEISTDSFEASNQPEQDLQMEHGAETASLQNQVAKSNIKKKRPLKIGKTGRLTIRKIGSSKKLYTEELLSSQMADLLQRQALNPREKKLLMSKVRASLIPGSVETTKALAPSHVKRRKGERSSKAGRPKAAEKSSFRGVAKGSKGKKRMIAREMETIDSTDLNLVPVEKLQPPVPSLAYGLERVLFNPGVYHLRDPRSRVFNFDPYLESIMPVADFDFNALKEYITSSRDKVLLSAAAAENKKYTGSTSSMTSALAHFHFLLSQWRPVNTSNLSQGFPETLRTFTQVQRAPSAIFLRWRDGTYAIDADKEFDSSNILMMLGKSMEKLLTLPTQDFEKYRKENSDQISEEERNDAEAFHYTTMGDFLMRSQLDAHDPRVPGTGMFDLKTRAVVSIRMDAKNYHGGLGYEIRSRHGEFESYEREYYDMIRAAFLKYSLQVRMGRMDGIFVAFHNTERIFGFQYISLPEMDLALHGTEDLAIGDSEFKLSLELLNRVLDRATAKFPKRSLRLFFETREGETPFMYIFAEPFSENEIQQIQNAKKEEIEAYERKVFGILREPTPKGTKNGQAEAEWEEVDAELEDFIENDELKTLDDSENPNVSNDTTVFDSENSTRSSVVKAIKDSATRTADEQLLTMRLETDQGTEGNTESWGGIEKQPQRDEAEEIEKISCLSDGGEENQITTGKLDTVEDHRTEESCVDTPAASTEVAGKNVEMDKNVGDVKAKTTLAAEAAGIVNVDCETEPKGESKKIKSDLLAMTLAIRNKVNGKYVTRPENIGPDDRWSIEYALAEVSTMERSHSLYTKTQQRRSLILKNDKKDVKSDLHRKFHGRVKAATSQSRKWRQQQNDIDREKPKEVLGCPV